MKATLAPGRALLKVSWCTHFNSLATTVMVMGANVTTITGLRIPVSTWPIGTAPTPPDFVDVMEKQAQAPIRWMSW